MSTTETTESEQSVTGQEAAQEPYGQAADPGQDAPLADAQEGSQGPAEPYGASGITAYDPYDIPWEVQTRIALKSRAAKDLGISENSIYKAILQGKIRGYKNSRAQNATWYVDIQEVQDAFLPCNECGQVKRKSQVWWYEGMADNGQIPGQTAIDVNITSPGKYGVNRYSTS